MKADIQIAQECVMTSIEDIANKIGIDMNDIECYGKYKAKLSLAILKKYKEKKDGKLILVTSINPTSAGEGKSTTMIGLGDALQKLGHKTMIAMREPSLGPVFGLKGGATGGGYAQVVPMEDINLHFTGDIHAVTTAHNFISACLDNHIFQGNALQIDIEQIVWKRCIDLNDRSLRCIEVGLGEKNGVQRQDGFIMSVASEIMAVLCLATSLQDLKQRLANMLVAYTKEKKPILVKDLQLEGALACILKDAIKPNLVQTLEKTPVIIHGGPFANIAHGCNSVLATKMCLKLADYTITEAGFGADLGAEKFFNIKCRLADIKAQAVVIVVSVRALKQHGEVALDELHKENVPAMLKGCQNLERHIGIVKSFGLPYVVTINTFSSDTPAEHQALQKWCKEGGHPVSLSNAWEKGSEGALDLAKQIIALSKQEVSFLPTYHKDLSIEEKIEKVAKECYGAIEVQYSEKAEEQLRLYEQLGWSDKLICMAKTPKSISGDSKKLGAPKNFILKVEDIQPSLGAGFMVVKVGNIVTMPGLPANLAATRFDIDDIGNIEGLF
ncbi:MAG: formate--tetrahydrofolate ligase [Erysipelotrichaceae bacterium]|nr:formate--tetrahydrofolate ligase [Erysipelotrichaceae bacterium]